MRGPTVREQLVKKTHCRVTSHNVTSCEATSCQGLVVRRRVVMGPVVSGQFDILPSAFCGKKAGNQSSRHYFQKQGKLDTIVGKVTFQAEVNYVLGFELVLSYTKKNFEASAKTSVLYCKTKVWR